MHGSKIGGGLATLAFELEFLIYALGKTRAEGFSGCTTDRTAATLREIFGSRIVSRAIYAIVLVFIYLATASL